MICSFQVLFYLGIGLLGILIAGQSSYNPNDFSDNPVIGSWQGKAVDSFHKADCYNTPSYALNTFVTIGSKQADIVINSINNNPDIEDTFNNNNNNNNKRRLSSTTNRLITSGEDAFYINVIVNDKSIVNDKRILQIKEWSNHSSIAQTGKQVPVQYITMTDTVSDDHECWIFTQENENSLTLARVIFADNNGFNRSRHHTPNGNSNCNNGGTIGFYTSCCEAQFNFSAGTADCNALIPQHYFIQLTLTAAAFTDTAGDFRNLIIAIVFFSLLAVALTVAIGLYVRHRLKNQLDNNPDTRTSIADHNSVCSDLPTSPSSLNEEDLRTAFLAAQHKSPALLNQTNSNHDEVKSPNHNNYIHNNNSSQTHASLAPPTLQFQLSGESQASGGSTGINEDQSIAGHVTVDLSVSGDSNSKSSSNQQSKTNNINNTSMNLPEPSNSDSGNTIIEDSELPQPRVRTIFERNNNSNNTANQSNQGNSNKGKNDDEGEHDFVDYSVSSSGPYSNENEDLSALRTEALAFEKSQILSQFQSQLIYQNHNQQSTSKLNNNNQSNSNNNNSNRGYVPPQPRI